jgi:hypothetical protein
MNDIQNQIDALTEELKVAHEEYKNRVAELSFKVKHLKRAQKLQKTLDRIKDSSSDIFFFENQSGE